MSHLFWQGLRRSCGMRVGGAARPRRVRADADTEPVPARLRPGRHLSRCPRTLDCAVCGVVVGGGVQGWGDRSVGFERRELLAARVG